MGSAMSSPRVFHIAAVLSLFSSAMLSYLHHHSSLLLHRHVRPNFTSATVSSSLYHHSHDHHQQQRPATTVQTQDTVVLRRHNSKSTSLSFLHIREGKQNQKNLNNGQEPIVITAPGGAETDESKILELSLVAKRTPQFPGSIYVQSPSDADVTSSLPPLLSVFDSENADESEMIAKALEIRRKVTREIFKESMMKKGRFGITYSTNLMDRLGVFIDHVMIEAAALKRLPEFSESTFNLRAKTVIEDSNVVPLIRWLKHHRLSYNRIGKLICMSRGDLDSIRRLTWWLKTIHVKGEFLGVVLLRSGDNILQRNVEELDEIVEYLESNGVRKDWMGFVMGRCPELLSFSMEELKTRVGFYLNMGMNEKDFGTMVFDYPKILGYFSMEEMNQKVDYLKEFGLSTEDVGRLLAFKPHLMGCSIKERWRPLVKYLYYLGISKDGMKRLLVVKPIVFCIDLEATIAPKVRFFQDLGIPNDAIGNMLAKFPALLTYSLYKKIRPVVIFLLTKAGVDKKNIGKVISMCPELLGCSIGKRLEINLRYFLSLGIRFHQLGDMIADFPMLLRYNIDVIRPKYKYLRRTMIRPLQDLIEFPRFLSYSLEGRIIPRHTIMVQNRINFKLRYMLACTNEQFEKRVREKVERRQRFESGLAEENVLIDCREDDDLLGDHDSGSVYESDNSLDDSPSELLLSDCSETEEDC